MEGEIWIEAAGWSGFYEVSNLGRVRSVVRLARTSLGERKYGGKILSPCLKKESGYFAVNLTAGAARKQEMVHRLILRSFDGEPPEGMEACHNDGNRQNNARSNLRWDTRKGNHADKKLHGTWQGGEAAGRSKLTDDSVRYIRSSTKTNPELAEELGVSQGCIEKARYRETWRHVE